ncbi:MAG: hypothetical protein OXR62_04845 [Ahrensia sp.]|nr:hypothetical protein [Ahrensia sp.]
MKKLLTYCTIFAALGFTTPTAIAADSCGYFAFAGAYSTFNRADRQASRVGGAAWGLDSSNSPNAGKGLWVVAKGPGSRTQANNWRRQYRNKGVKGAYVAKRCFYGE